MKIYGVKKTTIRATVKLPDCTVRIQRLYDYGAWFSLEEELLTDIDEVLNFMENMADRGAKRIDKNEFIDDDDLQRKRVHTYELIC